MKNNNESIGGEITKIIMTGVLFFVVFFSAKTLKGSMDKLDYKLMSASIFCVFFGFFNYKFKSFLSNYYKPTFFSFLTEASLPKYFTVIGVIFMAFGFVAGIILVFRLL